MVVLFLFIIGLFVGSFLNVVVDRLPRGENVLIGRSHCEFCKKNLAWYDLIPLLSFLLLHGKCRYCKKWIGWKYLLIECITGLLFAITYFLSFFAYGNISLYQIIFDLCIMSILIVIFFIDLWNGIIPDVLVLLAVVITFLYLFLTAPITVVPAVLSGLGASLFFLLLFAVTLGKGMGLGDVKLVFLLGLLLRWPNIFVCIYLAFLTGAAASLILILLRRKKFRGSTIPFGPFLVVCAYVTMFLGNALWNMIFQLIFHL